MAKVEQREVDGPHNVGLFALQNIRMNSIIFREAPFYSFNVEIMMYYLTNENPTENPILNSEIRELQLQIAIAHKKYNGEGSSFGEKYPPDARKYLDRLASIVAETGFKSESKEVQDKWLALHDAHKDIRIDTPVGIFGLNSEKGLSLNGKIGYCRGFDKSKNRYVIECEKSKLSKPERILLKKDNLKTISGIFRSNSFQEGLFEKRCRMNHSCNANTKTCSVQEYNQLHGKNLTPVHPNEVITFAKRDINIEEELTGCYVSYPKRKPVNVRREELSVKYNFICQCEICVEEHLID